ncbi:MAG: hypothetical protein V7L20_12230 [Nostoc sp.]|uniref:hypothetical protein n=1 Tax=Nostoc sp. TaxID=1180 RepID=UPI002FFB67FD
MEVGTAIADSGSNSEFLGMGKKCNNALCPKRRGDYPFSPTEWVAGRTSGDGVSRRFQ